MGKKPGSYQKKNVDALTAYTVQKETSETTTAKAIKSTYKKPSAEDKKEFEEFFNLIRAKHG